MIGARPLEDEEIERLLQYGFEGVYANRNKTFFAIGISTGFRASELLSLSMRDIMHRKYVKNYIKVTRQHTKGKTIGRTLKLHQFAKDVTQKWIYERLEEKIPLPILLNQPVFISREHDTKTHLIKPITVTQSWYIMKDAFELCNVVDNVSTHSMRKTFAKKVYYDAVRQFKNGQSMMDPIRVVQNQLGHKLIQSTLSYLSFIGSETDPELFRFKSYAE